MGPTRIQLRRIKGWRMPANTVKVDRTTKWGNPYRVGRDGTAAECVAKFTRLLEDAHNETSSLTERAHAQNIRAHLPDLMGKNLACWCPLEAPCHATVLLRLAANEETLHA